MPRLRKLPTKPEDQEALTALIPEDKSDPTEAVTIELPEEDGLVNETVTVQLEPEKTADDDAVKSALASQQRAEDLQRQLAEEQRQREQLAKDNARLIQERDADRLERDDAQFTSVLTAIAAEQSALAKAESDQLAAANAADWPAHAKASREAAVAAARLDRLEDNKRSFETQRETQKNKKPEPSQTRVPDGLPAEAKAWLDKHPEFMTDTTKNNRLGSTHNYLVGKGVRQFSPEYFEALDAEFGFKQANVEKTTTPQKKSTIMTAPVSRDVPSTDGTRQTNGMTLTPEERIIARNSFGPIMDSNGKMVDLTNAQKEFLYAQNKAKLRKLRANGEYRQTTEQTG